MQRDRLQSVGRDLLLRNDRFSMLRRTKSDEDRIRPAVELLRRGAEAWNVERGSLGAEPHMAGLSYMDVFPSDNPSDMPGLYGYDFSDCLPMSSTLRIAWFVDCKFDRADVSNSDLADAGFERCSTNTGARNAWTHHGRTSSGRPVAPA